MIKRLSAIPGPVGHETKVQDFLEQYWKKNGFETSRDNIGNLFGLKNGSSEGAPVAIVSHADTIGFLVQEIYQNGFVKPAFNTAASVPDARYLPGEIVEFLVEGNDVVRGHFGLLSGHLAGISGKKKPVVFDDMFIDIGVDFGTDVRDLGIDVGTAAVFSRKVELINNNIVGPGMDNRVACAIQCILSDIFDVEVPQENLLFVSTVQEEIGTRGAAAAVKFKAPGTAIILDVGLVDDIPAASNIKIGTFLGRGPILVYKDQAIHYSTNVLDVLVDVAKNNSIKIQKAIFKNYLTDGVQFMMAGIPAAVVGIPCRYTHTSFETVRVSDIMLAIDLLVRYINRRSIGRREPG